jgi:hypothetical protein
VEGERVRISDGVAGQLDFSHAFSLPGDDGVLEFEWAKTSVLGSNKTRVMPAFAVNCHI